MPSDIEVNSTLFASATAGAFSKILFHPIDTAKSIRQANVHNTSTSSATEAFFTTLRNNGIGGLYRGIGAVLIGGTPATMIYLTTYEISKSKIEPIQSLPEFLKHFICGMTAEAFACSIFVPVDVIKERLQVYQKSPSNIANPASFTGNMDLVYTNSFDSLKKIMKHEGLSGIYKGYAATLFSYGPFSAFYFAFYEQIKSGASYYLNKKSTDLTFIETLVSSATAGSIAAYITTPLDLVKLRMQIERGKSSDKSALGNRGMVNMLKDIYTTEGVTGLFRGSTARVMAYAPCAAVAMAIFESCKDFWSKVL